MLKSVCKFQQNMAKSHKTCMEQAEIIDTFGTYQWSPEGGSSFLQGAGVASPSSPDLETAMAAVQGEIAEGASRGPTGQPGGLLAWPRVGPRQVPFWSPFGGPPL